MRTKMMTNKYLEKAASMIKEALNAQKAREMAKKVGVIPEASTNWKYGLRRLRDSRGEALTGNALEEGRQRLGSMGAGNFQALRHLQKQHHDRELGFFLDPHKNMSNLIEGGPTSLNPELELLPKGWVQGHTHHTGPSVLAQAANLGRKIDPTLAMPGGLAEHHVVPGEVKHLTKSLNDVKSDIRLIQGLRAHTTARPPRLSMKDAEDIYQERTKRTQSLSRGDVRAAIVHPDYTNGYSGIANRIIATPELGVEGLHRSVGISHGPTGTAHLRKHRTVLLQHPTSHEYD